MESVHLLLKYRILAFLFSQHKIKEGKRCPTRTLSPLKFRVLVQLVAVQKPSYI